MAKVILTGSKVISEYMIGNKDPPPIPAVIQNTVNKYIPLIRDYISLKKNVNKFFQSGGGWDILDKYVAVVGVLKDQNYEDLEKKLFFKIARAINNDKQYIKILKECVARKIFNIGESEQKNINEIIDKCLTEDVYQELYSEESSLDTTQIHLYHSVLGIHNILQQLNGYKLDIPFCKKEQDAIGDNPLDWSDNIQIEPYNYLLLIMASIHITIMQNIYNLFIKFGFETLPIDQTVFFLKNSKQTDKKIQINIINLDKVHSNSRKKFLEYMDILNSPEIEQVDKDNKQFLKTVNKELVATIVILISSFVGLILLHLGVVVVCLIMTYYDPKWKNAPFYQKLIMSATYSWVYLISRLVEIFREYRMKKIRESITRTPN